MRIEIDIDDLRPLVEAVVRETLATVRPVQNGDDRITYTEAEAAALLGLEPHVLREQRKLRRIECCNAKPGRRILYRREHIDAFLNGGDAPNEASDQTNNQVPGRQ